MGEGAEEEEMTTTEDLVSMKDLEGLETLETLLILEDLEDWEDLEEMEDLGMGEEMGGDGIHGETAGMMSGGDRIGKRITLRSSSISWHVGCLLLDVFITC